VDIIYYFYAMKSLVNGDIYKGISSNPSVRIVLHNTGQTPSIRAYLPYELVYLEKCENVQAAREREKYYKTGKGREELNNKIK
jgi:putative endonuclease